MPFLLIDSVGDFVISELKLIHGKMILQIKIIITRTNPDNNFQRILLRPNQKLYFSNNNKCFKLSRRMRINISSDPNM